MKFVLMNIFSKCNGNGLRHYDHDPFFGGKKIYLACIGIWLTAFVALLPDITGVTNSQIIFCELHEILVNWSVWMDKLSLWL